MGEMSKLKAKENEMAKEGSEKLKPKDNIKVEGNDQDVLAYLYN